MAGSILGEHDAAGVALIADRRGRSSRRLVERGLEALHHLSRGAALSSVATTAGILTAIPWDVVGAGLPAALRDPSMPRIAAMIALEPAHADRAIAEARAALNRLGWYVMAWRDVPVRFERTGRASPSGARRLVQFFARAPRHRQKRLAYRLRLAIEARWARLGLTGCSVASLSDTTMVYKAAADPSALAEVFPDLADPRFASPFALVHFEAHPAGVCWGDVQPFHGLAHDGEVRTIAGNRRWMEVRIRDAGVRGDDLLSRGASDGHTLDAAVQWLREAGLSTPRALARLLPHADADDERVPHPVRTYLRHEACYAEPWEGPAAIAFADGTHAGALDRGGRRKLHVRESDDLLCVASGSNVFASEGITADPSLGPGEMIVLELATGAIARGQAVWEGLVAQADYGFETRRLLHRLDAKASPRAARAGSSETSLRTLLGRRGQWMAHALAPVLLELDSAVLTEVELDALLAQSAVRAARLPLGHAAGDEPGAVDEAIARLGEAAATLAAHGTRILVLSDRRLPARLALLASLDATAAVDRALRAAGLRLRASIVVEAADIRDARHAAALSSIGASAVVPRLSGPSGTDASRAREAFEAELRDILRASGVRSWEAFIGAGLCAAASAPARHAPMVPSASAAT